MTLRWEHVRSFVSTQISVSSHRGQLMWLMSWEEEREHVDGGVAVCLGGYWREGCCAAQAWRRAACSSDVMCDEIADDSSKRHFQSILS
jgi:hypothetical protein